ncbi:unnamed protein product [Peniophora sp. CBMAI 1063]|nr:unnamed protein product [Peniophora sp. CBMAI 1063]
MALQIKLQEASLESAMLRTQLETQRYASARRQRTIHHLRTRWTREKRGCHSKPPSTPRERAIQTDNIPSVISDVSLYAVERELELQRTLANESRRHAEELEESYAEILAFKDAVLAGLRADHADQSAQLRVIRKELKRAEAEAEDSLLRGELRALEGELDEQYQLLTHAARNAVDGANRMAALVHDNTALRSERDYLREERADLASRVEALESASIETNEQRALEANFLEHLRDELASATAYTVISNSPDFAAADADLGSRSSSPLMHLPNISASSLLDEDLPASLPISPHSPPYTNGVQVLLSSPPPRYSHPASTVHSRSTSLYVTLAATDGSSPIGGLSPATSLPSLPSSDPVTIRAFELSLDEYVATGTSASGVDGGR